MNYKTIHRTDYRVKYIDIHGKDHDTCKTYRTQKAAQNFINWQQKPAYVRDYYIKPENVTYQKLIS